MVGFYEGGLSVVSARGALTSHLETCKVGAFFTLFTNQRSMRERAPHVQSRLCTTCLVKLHERSIPACAGERPSLLTKPMASRVNPRVCGGEMSVALFGAQYNGQSPRVRGRVELTRAINAGERSIPACAGESLYKRQSSLYTKVLHRPRPRSP